MGIHRWYATSFLSLALILSVSTSYAATRVPVKMPSASSVANGAGTAAKSGENVRIPGTPGTEYIPRTPSGTPGTPIKVIPTIDYSIPRTINQVKSNLKANAAQAVLGAAVAAAVAGVGWVMNPENTELKRKGTAVDGIETSGPKTSGFEPTFICSRMGPSVYGKITPVTYGTVLYAVWVGPSTGIPSGYNLFGNNCTQSGFPPGAVSRARAISDSDIKPALFPLGDADWNSLGAQINGSTADFIKSLIKESCNGSNNPGGCFDSLMSQSALSGPATVSGGTTTTTSSFTRPDGSTGVRTQESTTNYNVTYGPNYFDFTKTVTNNTYEDGVKVDGSVETENPDVTQEVPPEEDDKEEEYTFQDSTLPEIEPFYDQQYEDGLEGVWNDKRAEFQDSAFMSFLSSFIPSFSGSCPAFGLGFNIASWASYGYQQFGSICYVLDFVKVVVLVSAAFLCRAVIFGG